MQIWFQKNVLGNLRDKGQELCDECIFHFLPQWVSCDRKKILIYDE